MIFIFLPAIVAGAIYAAWTPSLEESRDIAIIVFVLVFSTLFFVAGVTTIAIGLASVALVTKLRSLVDESLSPALGAVKDAADTVRGTTEFVGRTAVTPVAKAYGTFVGLKKGLSVLSGLKGRKK